VLQLGRAVSETVAKG